MRLALTKKKSLKGKQEFAGSLFIQNQLISNCLKGKLAMPSLTHQLFLLFFCHRSSENPVALLFNLFPYPHFHFTSALLPPPPLTTCWSLFPKDVTSVPLSFWFMTSVMWVCMCSASLNPAVSCGIWRQRQTGIFFFFKKSPPLSHFPCLSFAGLTFFYSHFVLPLLGCRMQTLEMQVVLTSCFSSWIITMTHSLFSYFFYSLAVEQKH